MKMNKIAIKYSTGTVKETIDRLEELLAAKDIKVYARIDQQWESARAGIKLPPLEFILFGNPKSGGPLMSLNPFIALDLPLKVIAWQDSTMRTVVAYNTTKFLKKRYGLQKDLVSNVDISALIDQIL